LQQFSERENAFLTLIQAILGYFYCETISRSSKKEKYSPKNGHQLEVSVAQW
jgi:hypothetical protein